MKLSLSTQSGWRKAVLSVFAGLLLVGVLLKVSGHPPLEAYQALWEGATGLRSGKPLMKNDIGFQIGGWRGYFSPYVFAQSCATLTPLLFAGLAIALGLRAGLFNIGVQGQMTLGALVAASVGTWGANGALKPVAGTLSPLLHVPLTLMAGALAGAAWGALAGLLKAKRGVHEVLSTIMLNYFALNMANYLISHNLKDPNPNGMALQTGIMARSSWLAPLVPNSNLTAGLFIALACAAGVAFLLRRTAFGYEVRATGVGAEAAQAAGISVGGVQVKVLALAGALAGIAGALEVMGVHHRYVQGTAGEYGFDGIAVALLGGLNAGGVTLSAIFFGALSSGAGFMQLQTNAPKTIATLAQAIIILFAGLRLQRKPSSASAPQDKEGGKP